MPTVNRRSLLATSAAFGGLAITGLNASAQATPRRGGTLRVSVDQAVSKLNPLLTRVNPEYLVAELLYSGLTRLGLDMSAEPDLAESWTNSADLLEWTFNLRKGLSFHDGSPCTAADVVASFEAILDPKTASPARQNVGPISKITAKDDNTVVFTLSAPFADLPVTLAYTNAKVVPAAVIQAGLARLDREAIGTGPFRLVSFEPERQVVVARNDVYYDKARPYLDRVVVVVYPDSTAEGSALIAGDTDLISTVPPTEFARVSKAPGVKGLRVASGQFCNVNFGCDQKPFNDVRVRQALALTVDRNATCRSTRPIASSPTCRARRPTSPGPGSC
jgi:peptide/nickel transport system substrate-binding protein